MQAGAFDLAAACPGRAVSGDIAGLAARHSEPKTPPRSR
jgi:hypothetical protein